LLAAPAHAQQTTPPPAGLPTSPAVVPAPATAVPAPTAAVPASPAVADTTISDRREATNDQKDWHFIGHVEMERPAQKTIIYADDVRYKQDGNHAIATGNVVIAQGNNRLSAENAEFNTETGLGTFYHAWGIASVQPPRQAAGAGPFMPPSGQDTTVYFFGDKIEKLGAKKYRITNGGFSTCVQPTPRWDLHADTVILNVDHYTLLKQAVFTVKGVPMLYLPILYYPTKREDRATGVLIPTYGVSSIKGQSLHDAFFWAINRSQDATFMHDWYSKAGQGVGSEYRYNFGGGSDGNFRAYMLNETITRDTGNASGTADTQSATRSYEIRGGANQLLPGGLRARANVNYFSSLETSQAFNTNIYDITRNQRSFGGNVIGAWGTYTLNGTIDHSEYFYDKTQSNLTGSWPRVVLARNERPLLGTPLYFSVTSEYVHLLANSRFTDTEGVVTEADRSLTRLDVSPQIRFPFKKWQWFTVNSTASWRDTYYSRSLEATNDPKNPPSKVIDAGLNRRFYSLQSQIVGPVFNRIWDTPGSAYAEKFKHTVEPFVTIQRTSSVDNYDRVIVLDGGDFFTGGTSYTYGINNRFFAKRVVTPGLPAQAREFVSVELAQSYYTNQLQALYDQRYSTSQFGNTPIAANKPPSHFSAIKLSVRATPTNEVNATVSAEFDPTYHQLRTLSASGTYTLNSRLQTSVQWSKKSFIAELPGFNDPAFLDHSINTSTNVHTRDNRVGGIYSFNYDVLRASLVQQRISGFYSAQCCGIAFEYQTYNFPFGGFPSDHRFFMSFTLAGLGNFSPFNGALSGVPR
jgi:LPS-assembly protein